MRELQHKTTRGFSMNHLSRRSEAKMEERRPALAAAIC
jgi:hypothetical protein